MFIECVSISKCQTNGDSNKNIKYEETKKTPSKLSSVVGSSLIKKEEGDNNSAGVITNTLKEDLSVEEKRAIRT